MLKNITKLFNFSLLWLLTKFTILTKILKSLMFTKINIWTWKNVIKFFRYTINFNFVSRTVYFYFALIFWHWLHEYGRVHAWIFLCRFKLDGSENFLWQEPHWYGFSPVWTLLCFTKLDDSENFFGQEPHSYGLSPEWIRLWRVKSLDCENFFGQISHWNGLE